MNDQLAFYPPFRAGHQKLDEDQLIEIQLEANPKKFFVKLLDHKFNIDECSYEELVDELENIEEADRLEEELAPKKNVNPVQSDTQQDGQRKRKGKCKRGEQESETMTHTMPDNQTGRVGRVYDPSKYCNLHHVKGHDLEGCDVMQEQAKKMRLAWDNKSSAQRATEKKRKQEMHALFANMVRDFLERKRKREQEIQPSNHNDEWPNEETTDHHWQEDDSAAVDEIMVRENHVLSALRHHSK